MIVFELRFVINILNTVMSITLPAKLSAISSVLQTGNQSLAEQVNYKQDLILKA
jgi:hypothetical protein